MGALIWRWSELPGRAGPKRRVPGYPPFRGSYFVNKTAGSLATRRLHERATQPRSNQPTALQPLPRLATYQQAKGLLLSGYPLQVTAG